MATVIKPKRSETGSSVPTTANLAVGEMAVNTADQKIYVRDSADNIVVVGESSTATAAKNMFVFTATASQTTFSGTDDDGNTLSYSAGTGKTNIYLNGILLDDSDYTATNGTSVVLSSGAAVNDILTVEAFTISSVFELSDDASPQLGANLDLNSNNITGTGDLNFTGSITLTGTVDGRDIATDGTKLDGIEASADVTDTTNVTAAGALMDSEVTNLAEVKAFSSADYATAAQGTTADSALQDVVDDTTPQLGGSLDANGNTIDMDGNELILDADGDTSITADTDDQIDIKTAGSDRLTISGSGTMLATKYNGTAASPSESADWPTPILALRGFGNYTEESMLSFGYSNDAAYQTGSSVWCFRLKGTASATTSSASTNLNLVGPGDLLVDAGDLHSDGDVIAYSTTTSDVRLKSDVEPITNALSKVNQLSGYTFTRNHNKQKSAGILAHELEKVLPEAVREKELPLQQNDGEKYKVVEYDAIHGLLIEAIKELSDKVERLEARLEIEDGLGNK